MTCQPHIAANAARLTDLSDRIWDTPELGFAETFASAAQAAVLGEAGFEVRRGVADLETALMAEAGRDGPVIAFLGEFDALPSLSQKAGLTKPEPIEGGGNGPGCGHNLL